MMRIPQRSSTQQRRRVFLRFHDLIVYLFILGLAETSFGQELTIPYKTTPCPEGSIFSTSKLNCTKCPEGTSSSRDQLRCVSCDSTAGSSFIFDENGFSCFQEWTAAKGIGGSCYCENGASDSVIATLFTNGSLLQRCVRCTRGTMPDEAGNSCISQTNEFRREGTPQEDLQFVIQNLGLQIGVGAATEAFFPSINVRNSVALSLYLGPTAKACLQGQDLVSCNGLANLCVLQQYSTSAASCIIYDALLQLFSNNSVARQTQTRPETGPLPWLYYGNDQFAQATDVGITVRFSGGSIDSQPLSKFTFVLSSYALNGTWLGFVEWGRQFQLCGINIEEAELWRNFGWEYINNCELDLSDVLERMPRDREAVFYDPFLLVGPNELYPVPVQLSTFDTESEVSVRRFFYVEGTYGTSQGNPSELPKFRVVQFPSKLRLAITQRSDSRDQIFPPQLHIEYSFRQVDVEPERRRAVAFSVDYLNSKGLQTRFWRAWEIMLIVFETVFALPLFLWKVFRCLRTRKSSTSDQDIVVFAIVALIDAASLALFATACVSGLYYLIVYKLQTEPYFMMIKDKDVQDFRITVIVAIVGQAISLVYMIVKQVSADIFFLDWEKPHKVLSRDGSREVDAQVSAWRMLLVANEFQELQTYRVTVPAFTLLMMVLILSGQNLEASSQIAPRANDFKTYRTSESSIILRWGIETAFFFVLLAGEYLLRKYIYFPYISDPITNFIDLAYLANISVIIMSDKHAGSYIHGRNHLHHSDATLWDLNNELDREGDGLVAHRGFIPFYQSKFLSENQVFQIYMTESTRRQYEQRMLKRLEQAVDEARVRKGQARVFFKGTGRPSDNMLQAKDEVSGLMREMVEDVERNYGTQVIVPTFLQMYQSGLGIFDPRYLQILLQLPPAEAFMNHTVFVHDYFRHFTDTMFFGNELRLFIFEALFFMAIDTDLKNASTSALITFVVSSAFAWVRQYFGRNNLSKKATIDNHFLI